MRTIQEVGEEILNLKPKSIYAFLGDDYGIKRFYINKLKEAYNGGFTEISNMNTLLTMLNTRRIIPLKPQLYIIRYDAEFVGALSDKNAKDVINLKITGTVVLIYEDQKHCDKIAKYLPDICVKFDKVSSALITKYLIRDYPKIPNSVIQTIVYKCDDYARCDTICRQLSNLSVSDLSKISDGEIWSMFNISNQYTADQLKQAVIYRDSAYLLRYLDNTPCDIGTLSYIILGALVDIDKSINSKFHNKRGDVRDYWTVEDVCNMYDITYRFLRMARFENIISDNTLYELVMLLRFMPTPRWEDIENDI